MKYRSFGDTGLQVSMAGFGAGHIGSPEQPEKEIIKFLNKILDEGINLIDTARSYGLSEERIGKILHSRRAEFILSTKVGYTYQDKPDWSYEAVMGTIEESLSRLKTSYIDIVHLHSCNEEVLQKGDAILALEDAKRQGKIRFMAYSGENDALKFAIESRRFDSIQCSVNPFDQRSVTHNLPIAAGSGHGIIAKRPLGNAVWRYSKRPDGHGHALYYDRMNGMNFHPGEYSWNEIAIRFSAYSPNVDTIIIGSSRQDHFFENIAFCEKGELPDSIWEALQLSFRYLGESPEGLI